jgi:hypothetical protein
LKQSLGFRILKVVRDPKRRHHFKAPLSGE